MPVSTAGRPFIPYGISWHIPEEPGDLEARCTSELALRARQLSALQGTSTASFHPLSAYETFGFHPPNAFESFGRLLTSILKQERIEASTISPPQPMVSPPGHRTRELKWRCSHQEELLSYAGE